jgi:cell division protein FtsL
MGRKLRSKKKNLERKIIGYGTVLILCLWAVSFFAKISLSSINIEVEKIKSQVKTQTEANQGLTMKINELASLENVNEVANNTGLAYNNSNIRIVNNR